MVNDRDITGKYHQAKYDTVVDQIQTNLWQPLKKGLPLT